VMPTGRIGIGPI